MFLRTLSLVDTDVASVLPTEFFPLQRANSLGVVALVGFLPQVLFVTRLAVCETAKVEVAAVLRGFTAHAK
jgi:hypothetical protein